MNSEHWHRKIKLPYNDTTYRLELRKNENSEFPDLSIWLDNKSKRDEKPFFLHMESTTKAPKALKRTETKPEKDVGVLLLLITDFLAKSVVLATLIGLFKILKERDKITKLDVRQVSKKEALFGL